MMLMMNLVVLQTVLQMAPATITSDVALRVRLRAATRGADGTGGGRLERADVAQEAQLDAGLVLQ